MLLSLACRAEQKLPPSGREPASALTTALGGQSDRTTTPAGQPARGAAPANQAGGSIESAGLQASGAAYRELTWRYDTTPFGPSVVVVAAPTGTTERLPVLVVFHGRGEALKKPERGARGWFDDYAMLRAFERLGKPPLSEEDLEDLVSDTRLASMNASLKARPYGGLIVVCPYLPDILRGTSAFSQKDALAGFVVDEILPRVYRSTPAAGTAATTAVDGVSLGGRAALLVGFSRPEAFRLVGGIQPAVDPSELDRFAALAQAARAKNPELEVRLLTSDGDYFRDVTIGLEQSLKTVRVPARLDIVIGPHDYAFNRGPGVYELLLYYDRALRRQPYL